MKFRIRQKHYPYTEIEHDFTDTTPFAKCKICGLQIHSVVRHEWEVVFDGKTENHLTTPPKG